MRKLKTTLLATVIAAAALMATTATAQADQPFYMADGPAPTGNPCYPFCTDTGFEGDFQIHNQQDVLLTNCEIEFSMQVQEFGIIEFQDYNVGDCWGGPGGIWAEACSDEPWLGEIQLKDNGQAWVNMLVCVVGAGGLEEQELITVRVTAPGGVRTWTQISDPDTQGSAYIDDILITDDNNTDNTYIIPQ